MVHDWTRVFAGCFHDFHVGWIAELRKALNDGLLPAGYYAQAEQVAGVGNPDVLTLEATEHFPSTTNDESESQGGAILVADHPPRVQYTIEAEMDIYAAKADWVAVRHVSDDRLVAVIELVSPGNKQNEHAVDRLLYKLGELFDAECHLLLVDLFPPGKHDPAGLHAEFWARRVAECPGATLDKPLTLAAYRAGFLPTAYFEPVGVGDVLHEMPLFLTPDLYVNVPLEGTYQGAWYGMPPRWKRVLEAP